MEGGELKDRLAEYETANYTNWRCNIHLDDGAGADGITFMSAGDETELKEGSFDLKDWQMAHVLD